MSILKGAIYITNDPEVVYNAPQDKVKIINLDEDGILQGEEFIGGTCLLPPMESKIAEVDNNEWQYDQFYRSHLLDAYQMQFISALIAYLYKGGILILFLPYTDDNTQKKLLQHMWELYGIKIGIMEKDRNEFFYYDDRCTVMWLNMIYSSKVISAIEYLYVLPDDVPINNNSQCISELIDELIPYGNTINEKINSLEHFRKSIKINPNIKPGIIGIH